MGSLGAPENLDEFDKLDDDDEGDEDLVAFGAKKVLLAPLTEITSPDTRIWSRISEFRTAIIFLPFSLPIGDYLNTN